MKIFSHLFRRARHVKRRVRFIRLKFRESIYPYFSKDLRKIDKKLWKHIQKVRKRRGIADHEPYTMDDLGIDAGDLVKHFKKAGKMPRLTDKQRALRIKRQLKKKRLLYTKKKK